MADSSQYELVLLGATGYTGKLTAEWVNTNLPSDLKWAIAGRNAKKLQTVIDELLQLNPNRKPPAIEICKLEKEQLSKLAWKTQLIITTIGPYMHYGELVLAACAEAGTHYLDCTGETPWYYDMVAKYDKIAQNTGAIIIPQCGLDSVPADITSYALTRHIRKTLNAPTLSVTLTLHDFKSGISSGTSTTAIDLFSKYSLSHLSKSMKPYSISPVRIAQPTTRPSSNFFYRLLGLQSIPELGGVQTIGVMAGVDTCLVHRSWGLFELAAQFNDKPDVSYGPSFRFTEYMRAKGIFAGAVFRLCFSLFGILLAFPPSRWIISPLVKKFFIPAQGQGPTRGSMKKDFMSYRGMAIADTDKKEKVMGTFNVAHGGYACTAVTLGAAAEVILRGDLAATEASQLGGGILTPATLGEQYIERLRAAGMKIEVGF